MEIIDSFSGKGYKIVKTRINDEDGVWSASRAEVGGFYYVVWNDGLRQYRTAELVRADIAAMSNSEKIGA
jgi:hypothetical protein